MDRPSFLSIYQSDPIFQTLAHQLSEGSSFRLQVKGLSGSLDMVLLAAYFEKQGGEKRRSIHKGLGLRDGRLQI